MEIVGGVKVQTHFKNNIVESNIMLYNSNNYIKKIVLTLYNIISANWKKNCVKICLEWGKEEAGCLLGTTVWMDRWMDGRVDGGSTGIQVPTELDKPLISTRG